MPAPNVPNTPTTPVVGQQSEADFISNQAWQAHKLRELLGKDTEELQRISANQPIRRIRSSTIKKGSLVSFGYVRSGIYGWKHDPYPLVLCSSIYHDGKVAGINLHYLTFKYIKYLIKTYCGKPFYYTQIKGNRYVKDSFRTYLPALVRNPRLLDCDYLAMVLGAVRSFNPNEVAAIRKFVQEQLRRVVNPKADDLSKQFWEAVHNNPKHPQYGKFKMPETVTGPYGQPYHWLGKATRGSGRLNPQTEVPGGMNINVPGGGTF